MGDAIPGRYVQITYSPIVGDAIPGRYVQITYSPIVGDAIPGRYVHITYSPIVGDAIPGRYVQITYSPIVGDAIPGRYVQITYSPIVGDAIPGRYVHITYSPIVGDAIPGRYVQITYSPIVGDAIPGRYVHITYSPIVGDAIPGRYVQITYSPIVGDAIPGRYVQITYSPIVGDAIPGRYVHITYSPIVGDAIPGRYVQITYSPIVGDAIPGRYVQITYSPIVGDAIPGRYVHITYSPIPGRRHTREVCTHYLQSYTWETPYQGGMYTLPTVLYLGDAIPGRYVQITYSPIPGRRHTREVCTNYLQSYTWETPYQAGMYKLPTVLYLGDAIPGRYAQITYSPIPGRRHTREVCTNYLQSYTWETPYQAGMYTLPTVLYLGDAIPGRYVHITYSPIPGRRHTREVCTNYLQSYTWETPYQGGMHKLPTVLYLGDAIPGRYAQITYSPIPGRRHTREVCTNYLQSYTWETPYQAGMYTLPTVLYLGDAIPGRYVQITYSPIPGRRHTRQVCTNYGTYRPRDTWESL